MRDSRASRVVRVVVVDDHPALRAGLEAVLGDEPGIVPVGCAEGSHDLWPLLNRTHPDVVLLDYHLQGVDGLHLCRRIKSEPLAPRVLLFSAYAGDELAVAARIAGADGVLSKGIPATQLLATIRAVADGSSALPPIAAEMVSVAASKLDDEDLPVLGMLLDGTPSTEVATVLGVDHQSVLHRVDRMIGRLRFEVPAG